MKSDIFEALLSPLVRLCIRHSFSLQELIKAAKVVFVRLAAEELARQDAKVNVSRVSVMTGIRRDEVKRIMRENQPSGVDTVSVCSRVLGQWREDPRFITRARKPRILSADEFTNLVRSVNKHLHSGTILNELKRLKLVDESKRGIRCLKQILSYEGDIERGFLLLARDMRSLVEAVEENMVNRQRVSNLHLRTYYDNVPPRYLPLIRRWLLDEGKAFHKRARQFLSQYDRDINPDLDEGGGSAEVVLGAFSMTPPLPAEDTALESGTKQAESA